MESQENTPLSPENASQQYTVYIEPGWHSLTKNQFQATEQKFRSPSIASRIEARHWNPQLAHRVRQHNSELLVFDGSVASNDSEALGLDWTWIPGTARELTGKDIAYFVAGDPLYEGVVGSIREGSLSKKIISQDSVEVQKYAKRAVAEGLITLAPIIGLFGKIVVDSARQDKSPEFTRRTLNKVAAGAGGLLTLGRLAPLVQSFNSNVDSNQVLQNITNLTRPIFSGTPWLDGRTAVLLAKAQAGLKEMGAKQGASATVIVGFPHAYESERLKKDPAGRAALIQTYAKEMIKVCAKILDEFSKDPEYKVPIEELTDFVLAYLTTTEIYELYDPEYTRGLLEKSIRGEKFPEGTPDNLDIAGRFSMNRIKRFKCEEIRQVLLPLGNPDRFFAE